MKRRRQRTKEEVLKFQRRSAIWIALIAVAVSSLVVIRGILLDNARRMGNEMARSYSVEGERNAIAYETLMGVTTHYIDQQLEKSSRPEGWIEEYLQTVSNALGDSLIDPYAVIDGTIIAANPWEGDGDYPVESSQWYQKALDAEGEIIYTDGYQDAITGKTVVTIAQAGRTPGTVVAFDIFPEQLRMGDSQDALPEGSSYFLCDTSGSLLYAETGLEVSQEELQVYIDDFLLKIREGKASRTDAYVHTVEGERWASYYDIADNGWISIIAIPYQSLLGGVRTLSIWYTGILTVFLILFLMMSAREKKLDRDVKRTNETVRVLGNSYYAIYRVDFSNRTYDMIKGSDYVRRRIPPQGDYGLLLKTAGEVIQPDAFEDFCSSFSIENIRKLVSKRTRDYGGDFKRLFGEEYRWVNVRLLFDESLNPEEAVLCFREVGEEKELQLRQIQLLRESLNAAKESEESRNSFFSSMSHDMRTPLNAIIGLSELAKKHTGQPEQMKEYLSKINYSSKQLLGLINDILEMARLENGKIHFDNRHFNVRKCIEDCLDLFQPQADEEHKKLLRNFEITREEVYGDSFRLTQILNNLLSNALKFTGPGGQIKVGVKELEQAEYVKYQITVSDTGAGMSEEFLDKIFVPYERETRFGARNISGTGLGMPITKNIISQMNGEITVKSKLGEGSIFTVTLPFKGVSTEAKQEKARNENAEQKEKEETLEGKRILLAEDNEINMEIACELLNLQGAQVTQAWNGREAVEIFENSPEYSFDVILMDMQMPEMDGCEAARRIRRMKRPDGKTVPIIAVTANAFAEDLAATTAAGMNAHISKPIDFKLLCKTIGELQ